MLGPNRSIIEAKDIEAVADSEATAQAKQLLDGHDIELWERGRFVDWFPTKDKTRAMRTRARKREP